jgi:hypothetical protein
MTGFRLETNAVKLLQYLNLNLTHKKPVENY